jgi:hypothetical protein
MSSEPSIQLQNSRIQEYVARMGSHQSHQAQSKYDPVPPYDMDDVESSIPASDGFSIDTITADTPGTFTTDERNVEAQTEQEHTHSRDQPVIYCSKCNRHYGDLTERERCNYAVVFVVASLVTFIIVMSIIMRAAKRPKSD